MVHFNTRLRDNTYAAWRSDYLDYKCLKKALKRQSLLDEQLSRAVSTATTNHPHGDDDDGTAASTSSASAVSDSESSRARALPSLLLLRGTPRATSELQSLLVAPVEFEELLEEQYDKVERAYVAHAARLRDQFALLRAQHRPDASLLVRDSFKNTLVDLHRTLHHLLNFALLNYTGFVKILKKHDKMFPSQPQLSRQQRARLDVFAFATPSQCRALLAEVEEVFADAFCDGDRAVAVASLMTRRDETIDWAPVYIGIKIGACLILLVWVVWDSLVVPTFKSERERHLIDLALTRAYPVYRGVGCYLLLHWLVGVSMYVWHHARVNYRYILELSPRTTPHYTELFSDATNMTIVYLVNVLLYYKVVNGYFPEQLLHRGYYPLALLLYTIYFYVVRPWRRQRGLVRTLLEIVGSPFFHVTFFHVIVGDYLTSTVKVNQDIAWSMCFFITKEFLKKDAIPKQASVFVFAMEPWPPLEVEASCATNPYFVTVVVPLICALPLWWRFLQSLRRVYDTKTWWPNLPNAGKYALAQVVALFGLFHPFYRSGGTREVGLEAFQVVWIALFTLSSLYTWVWDVSMDWGLGRPQYKFLGDRQMFSRVWVYYAAIVADLFLRLAWTVTLIPPHSSQWLPLYLQPITMVLELFRRTFWGMFRLENEHLRNTQGFRRVDFIPLHYDHGVGVGDDANDHKEPMDGHVFLMKILLVLFAVLGLSVLAIIVEK